MASSRLSYFSIHASLYVLTLVLLCGLILTQVLVIGTADTFMTPLPVTLLPSDALNESIYRLVA